MVCYVYDEIDHLAKDFPCCVSRVTIISVVRGRGSNKYTRGRIIGAHGGCFHDQISQVIMAPNITQQSESKTHSLNFLVTDYQENERKNAK